MTTTATSIPTGAMQYTGYPILAGQPPALSCENLRTSTIAHAQIKSRHRNWSNAIEPLVEIKQTLTKEISIFKRCNTFERRQKVLDICINSKYTVEELDLIDSFINALKIDALSAIFVIDTLILDYELTIEEVKKLTNAIKECYDDWFNDPNLTVEYPLYIYSNFDFFGIPNVIVNTELPRNLQVNRMDDGTLQIILLFNRCKTKNDPLIGDGTHKRVKFAIDLANGNRFARLSQEVTQIALDEFFLSNALSNLQQGIQTFANSGVTYQSKTTGKEKLSYLQAYCNGGDLFEFQKYPDLLSQENKIFITKRLLQRLVQLHDCIEEDDGTVIKDQIIHRDVKPENIYLCMGSQNNITEVYLGDLGYSCSINDFTAREKFQGTIDFIPPEYCSLGITDGYYVNGAQVMTTPISNAVTVKLDAWSCALVLFDLWKADIDEWRHIIAPWFDKEGYNKFHVLLHDTNWLPQPKDPDSFANIIWSLLHPNPNLRMSCKEALKRVCVHFP